MTAGAGSWATSASVSARVQHDSSRGSRPGSKKYPDRMNTPSYVSLTELRHGLGESQAAMGFDELQQVLRLEERLAWGASVDPGP